MKQLMKRLFSLLLCAVMLLGVLPSVTAVKAEASRYGYDITAKVKDVTVSAEVFNLDGTGEPTVTTETWTKQQVTYTKQAHSAPQNWNATRKGSASRTVTTYSEDTSFQFDTFEELVELAAGSYSTNVEFIYVGEDDLVISKNLTLPAYVSLYAWYAGIIVDSGVTFTTASDGWGDNIGDLTVKGTLNVKQHLSVDGNLTVTGTVNLYSDIAVIGDGTITGYDKIVDQDGWNGVYYQHYVETLAQMNEAFDTAAADSLNLHHDIYIHAQENFSFTSNLTIPSDVFLGLQGPYTYTIPSGKKITVDGTLFAYSDLVIAGTVVNNNQLQFGGWNWDSQKVQSVNITGSITGNGYIYVNKQDGVDSYQDIITGLDGDNWEVTDQSWAWTIRNIEGLTKLSAPKNLTWHKLLSWDYEKEAYYYDDLKGAVKWSHGTTYEPDGQYYIVCLYKDGEVVFQNEFGFGSYYIEEGLDCTLNLPYYYEFESGTYYVTIQTIARTEDYRNSDVVKSSTWTYTKPGSKVAKPTNLAWDGTTATWSAVTGAGMYHGIVYYAATEDAEPQQRMSFTMLENKADLSWNIEYVGPGYYTFKVRALSEDITAKTNGDWSAVSSAYYYGETPEAPTLKVTGVASSGKPKLTWNTVEGAAKYEVYRSTSKNGTYSWLATTTGTGQINKNAETGKLYYYKVRAVSASGAKSEWSNIVSRTCDLPRPTVKVTNDAATGKPKLTWNAVEGATKYQVYRSTSKSGTYEWLATTTGTSQINKNAETGELYYYKVRAIHSNTNANSAYSATVNITCDLARPTVKVTNDAATGKPKLTWNAVEGATKYQIYRSTSQNGTYEWLATTTGTSQINKNAVAGTKYYYKVRAVHSKSAANSAYSSVVSSTCDLPRPTLTVALNSSGKPKLSWNTIEGATKYQVYRSTDGKNWEWLATVTGTTQTNKNAVAGTTYYYRVRAIHSNSAANSAYSSYKSITAQ